MEQFGIAVAGVSASVAAVVITAIKVKANGNGNGNGKIVCNLHSGLETSLEYLKDKVDETCSDVKKILVKIGGV